MMPATRSNGSKSHPCAHYIRFTEEENHKLHQLTRRRKLTIQAFLHAAAMRAVNDANLGAETDAERNIRCADDKRRAAEAVHEQQMTSGLGIRERLERESAERRDRYYDREPTQPVAAPAVSDGRIVITQTAHSSGMDINAIAQAIAALPISSRRDALTAVCRTMANGRTREEAILLAEELDKAIKRIDGKPMTALERVRARRK